VNAPLEGPLGGLKRPVSRRAMALRALVPESLPPAGVGVIPAEIRLRRRAGPGGGGHRGDEAYRRSGGDRAAGRPPIPSRPSPDAPAPDRADRTMHGRSMDRRTMDRRTMNRRAVDGRAMGRRAMDRRTIDRRPMDRGTMGGGTTDGATNLSLENQAVAYVGDRVRPADNFDRLGRRQSETAEHHNDDRTPDQTEPLHGLFPVLRPKPGRLGLPYRRR
jgi:hypothetical protein